jgi:hypothetical protein
MSDEQATESRLVHQFKNQLSIIVGFCELLLADYPPDDSHREDLMEIQKAANAAMAMMPELSKRLR